jgi:phage terminase large subunit-like protein
MRKKPTPASPQWSSRAERNIGWCEEHLHLPEGRFVGQPLRMPEFMRDDLRAIYNNPHGTRRAIISRGRKNAKTSECAFLLLLHLCGPEHRINSQLFSCAQSRDQAAVLFHLAAKVVRLSPKLRSFVVIRDAAKELCCPEVGTSYKALSAEASTAFGLSPVLTVFDELGQVRGPRSELYEAMETATAAQPDPLTLIISTQSAHDTDLLSTLIDDAKNGHDPHVVLRFDTAPPDADPFAVETIRQANPAFDVLMNQQEVLAMAEDARRMPAREAAYKNLVLNQRVEVSSPFIARVLWQANAAEPIDFTGCDVFCGLDLGESADLTALVAAHCDPTTGVWHVRPYFWLPETRLAERAVHDRVPYDLWHDQGYLELSPGAAISLEYLAEQLRDIFDTYAVRKVAFDPWHFSSLRPWLIKAGFSETMIEEKFVEFRQGYKSMAPALRDTESLLLEGKLRHGGHPLLNWCAANAVVERDAAGNRKLSKLRSSGRIDGMVALVMAIGVAPAGWTQEVDVCALIG